MSNQSCLVKDADGKYSFSQALTEDQIIQEAQVILKNRNKKGTYISSARMCREYVQMKIAELEHEVFGVIFLDTKHRIIKDEVMFRGTIDGTAVYPREIVKEALACNCSAMIVYHNHPSGVSESSSSDDAITDRLNQACNLVGIKLLDHFICTVNDVVSYAELGKI